VERRAVADRPDAAFEPVLIDVDEEIELELPRHAVAEGDHVAELPGGVDMKQRERQPARMKGLARQMQHHRRVLADGIEHDRLGAFGRDLADDVDRFGLELVEMGEGGGWHGGLGRGVRGFRQ
jgi:hypothetical protein